MKGITITTGTIEIIIKDMMLADTNIKMKTIIDMEEFEANISEIEKTDHVDPSSAIHA